MQTYSIWEKRPTISSAQLAEDIVKKHKIEKEIAQLFIARGITTMAEADVFLHAQYENLTDPFLFRDMAKAVQRIQQAITNGEKIYIYGDYDADGIMATCILYQALSGATSKVCTLLPNRFEEGYGLNKNAVDKMQQDGAALIITVDNGATAFDEVRYAKEHHIDVIITDHHECLETLPEVFAILNPKNPLEEYPSSLLCGAGVAFKLAHALLQKKVIETDIKELIVFAMIGTVADMVLLTGENRQIVSLGLEEMKHTKNAALIQLMEDAEIVVNQLKASDISFQIAPRINASGRMTDANETVRMLCSCEPIEAKEKAKILSQINAYRQEEERTIFQMADEMVLEKGADSKVVWVLAHADWHEGVLGISAGRLAEKYHRPFILLSMDEEVSKGSARSIAGFNIFEAIKHTAHLLQRFGGHSAAAGLSLCTENIEAFDDELNAYAKQTNIESLFYKKQFYDMEKEEANFSEAFIKQMELVAPFGYGNPKPVIRLNGCVVENITPVGAEKKHISCKVINKTTVTRAIAFSQVESFEDFRPGDMCDILMFPQINTYRQISSIEYEIKDIFFYRDQKREHEKAAYRHFEQFYKKNQYHAEKNQWIQKNAEEVIEQAGKGNVFVAHSYTMYKRLVRFLRWKKMEERVEICFNEIKEYNNNKIYIVFCPLSLPKEAMITVLEMNCMNRYEEELYANRAVQIIAASPYQDRILLDRDSLAYLFVRLGDLAALCDNYLEKFLEHINEKQKVHFNYFTLRLAMDVFASLDLIRYTYQTKTNKLVVKKMSIKEKKDIYRSEIMVKLNIKK